MSWKYVSAEEFCDSVRDGTHDTPKPTLSGHKLVTSKHIKNGQINPSEAYCISKEDYCAINTRSRVEKWDVLMSMIGTVGEAAVVKCDPDYAIKNVALFKTGGSELKGKWLYYYLCSPEAKGSMTGNMKGSSQQFLSLKQLRNLPIPICDNRIMKKVVSILSAYDDLIENNQKQIKLLEEAAQRLYKEWFVDLHFPGYEHTKIVDGVPERWRIYRFSDKVDIMSGGTPKTDHSSYYNGTIPFYTPKDCDGAYFAFKTIINITEEGLNNCNSRLYPENTVIITARGTVGKTTLLAVPMAMNQSCYALKFNEIEAPYYLFFTLNKEINTLKTMSNGGVFNTIIVKTFDSIYITIPQTDLILAFETLVTPIMEQIKTKTREIFALSEARDRLLTKLVTNRDIQ